MIPYLREQVRRAENVIDKLRFQSWQLKTPCNKSSFTNKDANTHENVANISQNNFLNGICDFSTN